MSTYLKVDWKSGQFAEYSKEAGEGFEAYTNGNGDTRYKKLYRDGLTASLQSVEMRDSDFGMQLALSFKEGENWVNLQIPMLDKRDQVTTYAVEIARFLGNLVKGEVYRVYPYFIEKDGKENKYDKRGISFKVGNKDGEKVAPVLSWMADAAVEVRIPRIAWKENTMTGKKKPTAASLEAQQEFFANIFTQGVARFAGQEAVVATTPAATGDFGPPAGAKSVVNTPVEKEEDYDLPF